MKTCNRFIGIVMLLNAIDTYSSGHLGYMCGFLAGVCWCAIIELEQNRTISYANREKVN